MTLLRLDDGHRSAVIEMGANRRGDVEQLVQIARPGIGLITNAGAEHLEGFGSLEAAARLYGVVIRDGAVDAGATKAARDAATRPEGHFNLGPEREAYEFVWTSA